MSKNDSQIVISKKTLIVALIVLLLLVVGAVTVALNWNNWFGDVPAGPSSSQTGDLDIDPGADDWNGEKLPDKTDDLPGSSVHEIFQARVLEWGAISFSHIYSQACLNH